VAPTGFRGGTKTSDQNSHIPYLTEKLKERYISPPKSSMAWCSISQGQSSSCGTSALLCVSMRDTSTIYGDNLGEKIHHESWTGQEGSCAKLLWTQGEACTRPYSWQVSDMLHDRVILLPWLPAAVPSLTSGWVRKLGLPAGHKSLERRALPSYDPLLRKGPWG
jgi:hypothetical protein